MGAHPEGTRQSVAVLGASDNPERMSYQAVQRLSEKGHRVFPVNPKYVETHPDRPLHRLKVYASLADIPEAVDTISVYVSAAISSSLEPVILARAPRRVIFNPGAENPALAQTLRAKGIETVEACTLVLLSTNRF